MNGQTGTSPIRVESIVSLMQREIPPHPCWIEPGILTKQGKLLFGGQAKIGKALENSEPVLTKSGWKSIASLVEGEELVSIDKTSSFVTGVFPQLGERALVKLTFSDGRYSICSEDHLWQVGSPRWKQNKVIDTKELEAHFLHEGDNCRIYVPTFPAETQEETSLPIDPWVLGVLLGDGSLTSSSIAFASVDHLLIQKMEERIDGTLVSQGKYVYRIKDGGKVKSILETLGLYGRRSNEKFVPRIYKEGSLSTRREVLQGLLDTDGSVNTRGHVSFDSTSRQLSLDVCYLARSLGATVSLSGPRKASYVNKIGKRIHCLPSYRVQIKSKDTTQFVSLPRKVERAKLRGKRESRLTIKKIERIGLGSCTCISISHPTGLFFTRDFLPTHNSMIMLELAQALATGHSPFCCPHFQVPAPARVLLVEKELAVVGLQKRVQTAYNKVMLKNMALLEENYHYSSHEPRLKLDTIEGRRYFRSLILDYKPEVLLLDPIGKMHSYDENSNSDIADLFDVLDQLLELGSSWGMSIVMSHHFGKPPGDPRIHHDPLSPYNFRGASKWYDDPDTLVTIIRDGDLGTSHRAWRLKTRWETRQSEPPPEMVFTVNANKDLRVLYERDVDGPPPTPKRLTVGPPLLV